MTNLVIPHVLSVSNVALTNTVVVTTNSDGSVVTISKTGMTMVSIGPGAVVFGLVALALLVLFLWRTFGKGNSEEERGQ